ncbi:MAG: tol-pal system protein YbgF [Halioglobus sp.]|jgi:tol-pal system protein YbgF
MSRSRKALLTCGLVIMTGPLCLLATGQDYVDVEAERAARAARDATAPPADPYGVKPAQAYPATSYGLNSAPAVPGASAPVPGGQGPNLGTLLLQLQQLQQEVMRLNGRVEEQANELRKLQQQSLERYVDLDKRLAAIAGGGTAAAAATAAGSSRPDEARPMVVPPASEGDSRVAEQPGEGEAYRSAYALVRSQQFEQAVTAFRQFLQNYPAGKFAPNAHYWLGELYLVVQPPDLESSRQSFMLLLTQYPDNSKVPDAMYKLGKVHFLKGNRDRAREFLDRVIREHGDSSAAKLAGEFIAENY